MWFYKEFGVEMWNYAFIDWQNLHTWVKKDWWNVDLSKFRIYLKDKFDVSYAFYYIWYYDPNFVKIYDDIERAWFIIVFKQQTKKDISQKKWNVDSDMIFWVMKCLIKEANLFENILLVTWDWDFKILVDFLIQEWRFKKILFPSKKYSSSVYKKLHPKYYDYMAFLKNKIS